MLFQGFCLLAAALLPVRATELPAIEIVGNKFFYSNNGSQFYMKGIAYQQDTANATEGSSFVDPLADADACERDVPYLAAVATNTIRVYALNASQDHTACMELLQEHGIYVIADLSEPDLSIDRSTPSWTVDLYQRYTTIVDEFQNYTNILGFFAGNEVTNDNTNTDASAFVKAAVRDTKKYISDKGYRSIPVGYSSNDDANTRVAIADYFVCGDEDERADFYGINMYEWCGDSTFEKSGYADRTDEFKNLTVPVFFSEYGCNEVSPREFTEVGTLYSDDMTDVWSGGIVYMYFEEANNYGLISLDDGAVKTLEDYEYYSKEIWAISPTTANSDDVSSTSGTLTCPTQDKNWKASTDLPPTPDDALCSCMEAAISCGVSDDATEDDYSEIFGYICGEIDCGGIEANGTTGSYGAYSFCSSKQQLDFVLNLYYQEQEQASSACDFDGKATTKSGSTASDCSTALEQAGSSGLGTVTASLSDSDSDSTGTASGSSGTSTASSSSSGSSSSGATNLQTPNVSLIFASVMALVVGGGVSLFMI